MFPMQQPSVVYVQQPQSRPWLAWGIAAALALALGYFTGTIPKLPALPHAKASCGKCGAADGDCPPGCKRDCPPGCSPSSPPTTPPITPPAPPTSPNTLAAIGRIQFGNAGCTATLINPRRDDGRYDILTAAHCVNGPGQTGTMRLRDGRQFGIKVVSVDTKADVCWCITMNNSEEYPVAILADRSPPVGASVWHAGYGVDVPGNREDGLLEAGPDQNGQCRYRISVSSGDSGGGIAMDYNGHVLSPVCCTTRRGAVGQVWGGAPEVATKLRPKTVGAEEWVPLDVPLRAPMPMPK
jgi:hypothetical protein